MIVRVLQISLQLHSLKITRLCRSLLSTGMTTWDPDSNSYVDFIDYVHGGITYLISLGGNDASVMIVRLDGSGNYNGHAYSRVVMDWSKAPGGSLRTMQGFGAGYALRCFSTSHTAICMARSVFSP